MSRTHRFQLGEEVQNAKDLVMVSPSEPLMREQPPPAQERRH